MLSSEFNNGPQNDSLKIPSLNLSQRVSVIFKYQTKKRIYFVSNMMKNFEEV
jgi:hypothetical protein